MIPNPQTNDAESDADIVAHRRESLKEFISRHEPELRKPMSLPASFAVEGSGGGGGHVSVAERVYNSRRRFESDLGIAAAGPAMDILLELFIAAGKGRCVTVPTLCRASQVPLSTGLRYIYGMLADGTLRRVADPDDRSRYFVALSEEMEAKIAELMAWMGRRLSQ